MKICGKDYDTEIRWQLLLLLGWRWDESIRPRDSEHFPRMPCWIAPDGSRWHRYEDTADPLRSHDDCHALKEALVREGWHVNRSSTPEGKWVMLSKPYATDAVSQKFDTEREGVVTLAWPIAAETLAREEADRARYETLGQVPQ